MEYDVDKWDLEDIDDSPMNNKNSKDVRMAREYCDEHEFLYGNQTCEPVWDEVTGELKIYEIIVHQKKKDKLAFVKKRDGKKKKKKK